MRSRVEQALSPQTRVRQLCHDIVRFLDHGRLVVPDLDLRHAVLRWRPGGDRLVLVRNFLVLSLAKISGSSARDCEMYALILQALACA